MKEVRYLLDNNFINEPKKFKSVYIIQVGRRFCGENKVIDSHFHGNYFEFTVVNKGSAKIWANQSVAKINEGEIFLSFPFENHQIIAEDSGLEYDFFSFYTENEELNEKFDVIRKKFDKSEKRIFKNENVRQLIINLIGEFVNKNPVMKEDIIANVTEQILLYTVRDFASYGEKKGYNNVNNHDIFCYHVMKYINENLLSIISLSVLEEVFNYNYSYISDLFSKTTGITVVEYYGNKRMEKAKELIKEGKLSINQIASMLNYSSIYSFSKSFKQKYGISPTNFK